MTTRRTLIIALVGAAAVAAAPEAIAAPRRRVRRRTRRRTRRRVRRRHRRRVTRRVVAGVSYLVVPVSVAVGWELMMDNQVYTVTKIVPATADGPETVIITASNGQTQTMAILREDTPENAAELEGSEIPEGDTSTPGIESEVDE